MRVKSQISQPPERSALAGTFSKLADGSTLTIGSNTYQVSYEGGTGNDLTLTVQ